ncbi:type I toxin-antitoxin system SymE family toxin [Taibaiella lutea]|uniref:Type I toxin-antitoxin system SymE family toxin n=1 Tax=Taibaiella lutea TaxID=2608001 RepID=A0A5M6CBN7_9BACT|nr:SymE family type I addiction module toxin [Taibaiella lutea]KAA5532403.1 type I toxin-antitoxin system SymE family toxin [Taibaiella lutea]
MPVSRATIVLQLKSTYMVNIKKQNNKLRVRTLKVYDKIFCRSTGLRNGSNVVLYPEIRLIGKWLQDCGFRPGQHIEVITERNKLTIRHRVEGL